MCSFYSVDLFGLEIRLDCCHSMRIMVQCRHFISPGSKRSCRHWRWSFASLFSSNSYGGYLCLMTSCWIKPFYATTLSTDLLSIHNTFGVLTGESQAYAQWIDRFIRCSQLSLARAFCILSHLLRLCRALGRVQNIVWIWSILYLID